MALPQSGQEGHVLAPQTVRNRKYSLYTSRLKPLVTDGTLHEKPPQMPDLPTLPTLPRWDSLSHTVHLYGQQTRQHSTTSSSAYRASPSPRHEPSTTGQASFPVLGRPAMPPVHPIHGPGPRRLISRGSDARSASPSPSLATKPSLADMHTPDASPAFENFSRPRKPSIRQPERSDGLGSAESIMPQWAGPGPSNSHPADFYSDMPYQTPTWQRPRRPSTSSAQSSFALPSPLPRTRGEYAEPRPPPPPHYHRGGRSANGSPVLPFARTPMANGRCDNTVSTPNASPRLGGAAPWISGEELRSSFRSQLTASTTPGTVVTERSSVLTKDSSVTSFENPDEPSLEDVMCMYERGFDDDDDDDDDDDIIINNNNEGGSKDGDCASKANSGLRQTADNIAVTTTTTTSRTDESLASPLSTARLTLDAEIRQSRMIFTSPAFTSSVAAICGKADMDMDVDFGGKRDSAKSLDSETSIALDLAGTKHAGPIVVSSSSIPSPPRSPSPSPSAHDQHVPAAASLKLTLLSPPSPQTPLPSTLPNTETTTKPAPAPLSLSPLSPSPSSTVAAEPEDPGSRDRYGFKKANQSVTREQYDAWNKGYTLYLARRRRKWISYLKDCALMTDRPLRFPSPSAKTKRFIRKGIPPDWRGAAWFYYAGGPAILAKYAGLYEKLLHQSANTVDVEAIERDLHRTFPDNIQFKPSAAHSHSSTPLGPGNERYSQITMSRSSTDEDGTPQPGPPPADANEPPIITSLRRVLHAFSIYNPRIGYCQSLNFLAGLLLLFVETEEQCFWLLNVITIIYLPGTHDMSLEGSRVDLGVLMTELRETMPAVWDKIGGELENLPTAARPGTSKSVRKVRPMLRRREHQNRVSTERLPPITLCMTAWFMSCYIGTLPIETTLRVWDVFFYEGSKTLFRIALAIFKTGENEIKSVKDPLEMFGVVQAIPRRMIDANALMEACFKRRNGFGHLSQETIDERRQERRDKAKQDREQHTLREKASFNGDMQTTESESDSLSRRGTLFGKK
ncbi:hypothetical protein E4U43_008522 [Claviceps pusilla]|uniref:Rab-GAP TBC domain-containing protein n=1 Tax=Claviceps pusilla TaxID=123648 RepID=A0A9P7ND26_9HYPO|nr:hypothetical protein E4U43_008522 [Claviceps pusilla]